MADITATILNSPIVSRTTPAVSLVESTPIWNGAGWANAKSSLAQAVGAVKIHIFPFGLLDPWSSDASGPLEANPSLWATGNRLTTGLSKIREISETIPIILTLYGGSWFMKGKLHATAGTTTLMTYAERFDAEGRVMVNYLDEWLLTVDEAVTLAAAQGCRDFEVWNEAKGFYSVPAGTGQTWDARYEAGTANNANMGYSYFYQQTANQVVTTMTGLGHARASYRISGPYPVLSTRGASSADAIASDHPLYPYRTVWGYANKAPINFTRDFLGHARDNGFELDVLSLDVSTFLQSGTPPTSDPFDLSSKFATITAYWRDVLAEYGFDRNLPIDYSEIYSFPPPALQTDGQEQLRAAMWADCLTQCVLNGVRYPMMWSATGSAQGASNSDESALITNPASGSSFGTLTRVGEVAAFIKAHFGPGARVYPITDTDGGTIGMVSGLAAVLYNKTDEEQATTIQKYDVAYTLSAYETKLLTLPFYHERQVNEKTRRFMRFVASARRQRARS